MGKILLSRKVSSENSVILPANEYVEIKTVEYAYSYNRTHTQLHYCPQPCQ